MGILLLVAAVTFLISNYHVLLYHMHQTGRRTVLYDKHQTGRRKVELSTARKTLYQKYGGSTEWKQYTFFRSKSSLFPFKGKTSKNYTHNVKPKDYTYTNVPRMSGDIFTLKIEEFQNGTLSNGGSNFHIVIETKLEMDTCYYDDHLDGTYTAECALLSGCNTIRIQLHYLT